MKISGFTFLRNAVQFHYPFKESILSILPIVDEYIIVLGESQDNTRQELENIQSSKIKIIDSIWDIEKYTQGTVYAHQTDLAKANCTGDWLIYLQGDEIIHENDLKKIRESCEKYLIDKRVEGFVFNYKHFWGDFDHICHGHAWYDNEVRIIRNHINIHSWRDAQSFRWYDEEFAGNYMQIENTRPLNVMPLKASIYHYGWVRPPHIIKFKNDEVRKNYNTALWKEYDDNFDFGRMDRYKKFMGSHPKLMMKRMEDLGWSHLLRYSGPLVINREKLKHEKVKYRILTFIEDFLFMGYKIGQFRNYKII